MPRQLDDKTSFDDIQAVLAYTGAALEAAVEEEGRDFAPHAATTKKLHDQWEALDAALRAQRFAMSRRHAIVRRRDAQANVVTKAIHDDALIAVKLNRAAALFKRLFPMPLSSITTMALEAQLGELRGLTKRLNDKSTPAALKQAHAKALATVIARGADAIDARKAQEFEGQKRVEEVAELRARVNRALLGIEGGLTTLASARGEGKAWVALFFPQATAKKPGARPVKDGAAPVADKKGKEGE